MSVKDENNIPRLLKALHELEEYHVEIGIFGEDDTELLMIASVHEFGSVKVSVPERSFVRNSVDANLDKIQKTAEKLLDGVLSLRIDAKSFYETLGGVCVSVIQQYLTELSSPPLKDATIKQKGSSNPLIDTGRLRSSVTSKLKKG